MAWRLTIGGVDQTAIVDSFTTTVALNDRARGTVVVADFMPARYAELVSYAADGVTPNFGGVILQRRFQGRTPYDPTYQLTLEVGDWLTYADWCYSTKAYPVAVTLKQVLADLVAEHLAAYGITLDPAQADGPTIAPFTWTAKRVADALRELSDRTTYVVKIDPAKRLRMFVPAQLPAPVALTEATPNCHELTWRDAERTPYNTVVLTCGPAGPAEVTDERHFGDGVIRSWPLNAPFLQMIGALSVFSEGGGGYPVGIYGVDDQPWTVDLATNTMRQRADQPVIAAGDYWWIKYQAQFPFTVTRSTGATPIVEDAEPRPDVLSIPVAEEIADTLLAQAQTAPREVTITTDQDGFIPGQALTIALATTRSIAGTFLINSVGLAIVQDTDQGDRFWQYTVEAVESELYQGSDLDGWREIAGVGSGTTTISGGGGGGGEPGPPGPQGPPGTIPALPPAAIFVGDSASVATARPMSGDVAITAAGVTTVGHVANSATTATDAAVPNTIMSRNATADSAARMLSVSDLLRGPRLEFPGDLTIEALAANHGRLTLDGELVWSKGAYTVLGPSQRATLPDENYKQRLGVLNQKFLEIHAAELWVESLVAQQTIATIGGSVLVAPTTVLARDVAAADVLIYVKHNAFKLHEPGIEFGSKLYLYSAGKFEAMAVVNSTVPPPEPDGSYLYSVVRAFEGGTAYQWYAGDAVLDTGKSTTTSGLIDLYATSGLLPGTGIGPTIVGNVRTGPHAIDLESRWAIGNLNLLYGYTTDTYGAAFGVPAGAWIKIDPENGVRIGYNTTPKIHLTAAGDAFFTGAISSAAGSIGGWIIVPNYLYAIDAASYPGMAFNAVAPSIELGSPRPQGYADGNPGIWMGRDTDGVYKFRAVTAGGTKGFIFDGATAIFRGDGGGLTSINGGNIQTGSITAVQIAANTITATQIAANTITGGQIAGDTITAAHLAAGSVTASELAAGAVTAAAIAARSITADRIVVGALTATEIAANTITADRLNIGALSAITANLGTVTAGTITGVTINGTTFYAGGTDVRLDGGGLFLTGTAGTGEIHIGGRSIFADANSISLNGMTYTVGDHSVLGNLDVRDNATIHQELTVGRSVTASGNVTASGYVSATGVITCGTMNIVSAGTRSVYFNFGNNQFCFWTGAAVARENVQAWDPSAADALLDVPIVTHGPAGAREVGIVVEALADVAPAAVYRDAAGAPEGVRDDVVQAYLIAIVRGLAARVQALEGGS